MDLVQDVSAAKAPNSSQTIRKINLGGYFDDQFSSKNNQDAGITMKVANRWMPCFAHLNFIFNSLKTLLHIHKNDNKKISKTMLTQLYSHK